MLSIDRVDEWRDLQESVLLPVIEKEKENDDYDQILSDTMDEGLKLFLEHNAITEDSPRRAELMELYRAASIDKIEDDKWLIRPSNRLFHQEGDDDISQQDIFAQKIADMKKPKSSPAPAPVPPQPIGPAPNPASKSLPAHPRKWRLPTAPAPRPAPASAPPMPPAASQPPIPSAPFLRGEPDRAMEGFEDAEELNEKWNAKYAELKEAREKLAKLASKRQGKLFGGVSDDYLLAKQAYDDIARQFGEIQFTDDRKTFDRMDDEAKKDFSVRATEHIVNEQQKLREQTNENLQGTPVGKFVGWMQSGSRKKRIGKSIIVGAGGAAVGAGASFVLAGAGLVAGAGAVAVGASRLTSFARGYASHDKRGMTDLGDEHKKQLQGALLSASRSPDGALFDGVRNQANWWYEDDSRGEQEQRRRTVGKALAIAGIGAMAGEAVHYIADNHSGIHLHNPFAHHSGGNSHEVSPRALQHYGDTHSGSGHTPSTHAPHPTPGHHAPAPPHTETPHSHHGHSSEGGSSHGGTQSPSEHAGTAAEAEKLRQAATITPGEGFYQAFQKAGIPSDKWATILHQAGPKLHEQGLAYYDNVHQEWRIGGNGWHGNFPNRMPASGMKVITQVAAKNGYKLAA